MRRHFSLNSWAQKLNVHEASRRPSYASLNKWVFKLFLNLSESVIFLSSAGSAFHSRGPAAAKAQSPKVLVFVRGCMNVMCREVRSVYFTSRCSSNLHRYSGVCNELYGTSATVLYSKLSASLVTNVAAFARQRCVCDDAACYQPCSTILHMLQSIELVLW